MTIEMGTVAETKIDLSDLNLRHNVHRKSSMKNILSDYGLKDERKKKKKDRAQHSVVSHQDKDNVERNEKKKEKNLQVLKDLEILKDHYYEHYMELLRERVRVQEQKMKDRERRMNEKAHAESRQPARKKLTKHELITDEEYLRKVSKSQLYGIVREEARLLQAGQLKTSTDLEEFWSEMLMKSAMKKYNITDSSFLDEASLREKVAPAGWRTLTDIREHDAMEEMSQKPKAKVTGSRKPSTQKKTQKFTPKKNLKDLEERLFPKVEMPNLHCFNMQIGPPSDDPVELQEETERTIREKERWLFRKRLQKMYQLAMTNTASAKRIIANHDEDDVEIMMNSADVKELIDLDHFVTQTDRKRYSTQSSALVPYRGEGQGQGREDGQGDETSGREHSPSSGGTRSADTEETMPGTRGDSASKLANSRSSARSRCRSVAASELSENTPTVPLSLTDILPQVKVMEAKCLSTLWTNYAKNEEG